MSIQFVWSDQYSVGRADIDAQHKLLFELANTLPEVDDPQMLARIIMALYKHTREHFATEEQMMQELEYPGFEEHREQHHSMIARLNEFSNRPTQGADSFVAFKRFVYTWVLDHILSHDAEFFKFVHNRTQS